MTYKCIIIDDEPHAIEGLKAYIGTIPNLILVESYTDPIVALKAISAKAPVDVIFMDVDMPNITGIELARAIRSKTDKLVMTTAHAKHAFDAFEVDADAYLLKPYSLGKFTITFHKLFAEKPEPQPVFTKDDYFFVKSKEDKLKLVKIRFADLIAIESKLNYVKIHTINNSVLTYMSLTEISKMLPKGLGFIQVHRSFVINENHISTINGNSIRMVNDVELSVGEFYREDFKTLVNHKLIRVEKK